VKRKKKFLMMKMVRMVYWMKEREEVKVRRKVKRR
jgi:hypothetical protein